MKTNLKTCPDSPWKRAFEKELREKLVYPTNTKSIAVYDFIKKEILG
jgi:hypothetical protein